MIYSVSTDGLSDSEGPDRPGSLPAWRKLGRGTDRRNRHFATVFRAGRRRTGCVSNDYWADRKAAQRFVAQSRGFRHVLDVYDGRKNPGARTLHLTVKLHGTQRLLSRRIDSKADLDRLCNMPAAVSHHSRRWHGRERQIGFAVLRSGVRGDSPATPFWDGYVEFNVPGNRRPGSDDVAYFNSQRKVTLARQLLRLWSIMERSGKLDETERKLSFRCSHFLKLCLQIFVSSSDGARS